MVRRGCHEESEVIVGNWVFNIQFLIAVVHIDIDDDDQNYCTYFYI